MIHPVICDRGEIRPAEEVADVYCILPSHLYLYLHFFMYLHLKFDQYLYLHPPCIGTFFIRGMIYSVVFTVVCDVGEIAPAEEVAVIGDVDCISYSYF